MTETPDCDEVRRRALDLLARREHSVTELHDKLRMKAVGDDATRETVIAALVTEGLLSDARFIEAFVRSRRDRGQGPLRIEAELRRRGIERGGLDTSPEAAETNWTEIAREARRKRFGAAIPGDFSERARQARFLRSRGFTEGQVRAALKEE